MNMLLTCFVREHLGLCAFIESLYRHQTTHGLMARRKAMLIALPTGSCHRVMALSKATFFCIDPFDEPTQYATTLDAIPASVPSNGVTISR